jgi:hypothetical protein
MWPIQLALLLFIVCTIFLSSLIYVILLNLSHDRPNWSSTPFSNTTFQNFLGTSKLLSEVSNLCSKCRTLLVSSLNLSSISLWKEYYLSLNRLVALYVQSLHIILNCIFICPHITVFCDKVPRNLIDRYQSCGEICYLFIHILSWRWRQLDFPKVRLVYIKSHGVTFQETVILIHPW